MPFTQNEANVAEAVNTAGSSTQERTPLEREHQFRDAMRRGAGNTGSLANGTVLRKTADILDGVTEAKFTNPFAPISEALAGGGSFYFLAQTLRNLGTALDAKRDETTQLLAVKDAALAAKDAEIVALQEQTAYLQREQESLTGQLVRSNSERDELELKNEGLNRVLDIAGAEAEHFRLKARHNVGALMEAVAHIDELQARVNELEAQAQDEPVEVELVFVVGRGRGFTPDMASDIALLFIDNQAGIETV